MKPTIWFVLALFQVYLSTFQESTCEDSVSIEWSTKDNALCINEARKVLILLVDEEEKKREEGVRIGQSKTIWKLKYLGEFRGHFW